MARKCTGAMKREFMLMVIRRAHDLSMRGMRVNARHCYNIQHPIIQELLKRGSIYTHRAYHSSRTAYTYVVPVDGKSVPFDSNIVCPDCKAAMRWATDDSAHSWNCSLRNNWPLSASSSQIKNRRFT